MACEALGCVFFLRADNSLYPNHGDIQRMLIHKTTYFRDIALVKTIRPKNTMINKN